MLRKTQLFLALSAVGALVLAALGGYFLFRTSPTEVKTDGGVPSHFSTALPTAAADNSMPNKCSDVMLISLNGSEPMKGVGTGVTNTTINALTDKIKQAVYANKSDKSFSTVAFGYYSPPVSDLVPLGDDMHQAIAYGIAHHQLPASYTTKYLTEYYKALESATDQFDGYLTKLAATCPKASFVVAAYSQGTVVTHNLENRWAKIPAKNAIMDRVVAEVMVGDASRSDRQSLFTVGGAPFKDNGILQWQEAKYTFADYQHPERVIQVCSTGDPMCDTSGGLKNLVTTAGTLKGFEIHSTYATSPYLQAAVQPLYNLVFNGKPLPVTATKVDNTGSTGFQKDALAGSFSQNFFTPVCQNDTKGSYLFLSPSNADLKTYKNVGTPQERLATVFKANGFTEPRFTKVDSKTSTFTTTDAKDGLTVAGVLTQDASRAKTSCIQNNAEMTTTVDLAPGEYAVQLLASTTK